MNYSIKQIKDTLSRYKNSYIFDVKINFNKDMCIFIKKIQTKFDFKLES